MARLKRNTVQCLVSDSLLWLTDRIRDGAIETLQKMLHILSCRNWLTDRIRDGAIET